MAKELVSGETVGAMDDDGPEEGEIEDDTSEEDGAEKKFCSSNSTDVNTSVGMKYYQPSGSSKSESHTVKTKVYSEDKKRLWRKKRRIYNFYVDHDKPSRDSYNRLTKSDLNSDHRELNFHDLLKDYRTSKHGTEGNSHEKENRHYSKEARTDSSRKRESGVSESQEDKLKRSRKRKQHRSPSRDRNTSSDTDGVRKRKDVRNTRQTKNRKIPPRIKNLGEGAALFAEIRAAKLKAVAASEQQKTQVDGVQCEIENSAEVSEICPSNVGAVDSEAAEGKSHETQDCNKEGQVAEKEPFKNETSKSLCSASDTQTADKNEDSESKDEDDDVNQLRLIALQSAFRAKYLERKRRGIVVRKQTRVSKNVALKEGGADTGFNLDDTADLLEAAVEEAASSSANKETEPSAIENWQPTLFSSLSEVPLPPDDPPVSSPVEDHTPVDMELALTDEEEDANPGGNGLQSEDSELYHTRVRATRCISKARSIPVTIGGRVQSSKSRKRPINCTDNMRSNLLEVRTCTSKGQVVEDDDSTFVSMVNVNMDSMILLDEVGTCSSPEVGPRMEEEQTLSEASDAKSDLVQYSSNEACFSGNVDDEDEELLRARLLVEISRRHRGENITSNTKLAEESSDQSIVHSSDQNIVTLNTATEELETVMRTNGKSVVPHTDLQPARVKMTVKRSVERTRRGQLLARVRNRQVSIPNSVQMSVAPYRKSYLSKIAGRGKYQRVNQNRIVEGKKRIDGNLHVTVVGSSSKAKSVSAVPQKQDRIVICLGEDSDESDDERQHALSKRFPLGNDLPLPQGKSLDKSVEPPELHAMCSDPNSCQQPVLGNDFPVASVSADFEKSVDRFLKEVRSVQESRLQDEPHAQDLPSKENVVKRQTDVKGFKVNSKINVTTLKPQVNSKTNAASPVPKVNVTPATPKVAGSTAKAKPGKQIMKAVMGVTPQAVRHLPPPQQEEYRRLKMQISVLEELHKKRKAAEVSHASLRNERVIQGKLGDSKVVSNTSKLINQLGALQGCKPSEVSGGKAGESQDMRKTTKPVSSETNRSKTPNADDVEDEDVNLMREQLLRSRLHKKMNAMAEKSGMKSSTKETVPCGPGVVNIVDTAPKLCVQENILTIGEHTSESASVGFTDLQKKVVTQSKGIATSGDDIPNTDSNSLSLVEERAVLSEGNSSKETGSEPVKYGKVDREKGDSILPVSQASLSVEECPSAEKIPSENSESPASGEQVAGNSVLTVGHPGVGEIAAKGGILVNWAESISGVKTAATQASLIPPRSIPKVPGTGSSSVQFPSEINDTRASELEELEFQLLSERHAALQYLSELSSLLTKMEIEGAHLKQKEMAAQKLRAELNCAESAIEVQKDFLKKLALTISSTHERVMLTRQRCSMLCHACTRLGNQLKQDKRVNGGKAGGYQVPTGGAALVKSQLSSVLWQTKQLKKAGLPFLKGQNFVTSGKCPTAKKLARRTGVAPWSILPALAIDSLQISSSNNSSSETMLCTHPGSVAALSSSVVSAQSTNISFVCNAVSKSKTRSNPGKNGPLVARKVLPVTRSVVAPGQFIFTPSHSAVPSTAVTSSESFKVDGPSLLEKRPVDEVSKRTCSSVAPFQPTKSGVSGTMNNESAASEVPSSGSAEVTIVQSVSGKGVQLRDYHSPLEPVTNRNHVETATSAGSSLQLEESVMLDPNVILCPYDLMGECQDEECPYQHQRRKALVKGS